MHRLRTVHFVQERGWSLRSGGRRRVRSVRRRAHDLRPRGRRLGQVLRRRQAEAHRRPNRMLTDDLPQLVATSPESIVRTRCLGAHPALHHAWKARDRRKLGGPDVKIELWWLRWNSPMPRAFRVLCSFTMRNYAAFFNAGATISGRPAANLRDRRCRAHRGHGDARTPTTTSRVQAAGRPACAKTWLMANDVDVALAGSVEALQRHSEQPGRGASREGPWAGRKAGAAMTAAEYDLRQAIPADEVARYGPCRPRSSPACTRTHARARAAGTSRPSGVSCGP